MAKHPKAKEIPRTQPKGLSTRQEELRKILTGRRDELQLIVGAQRRGRIEQGGAKSADNFDAASDNMADELEFALVQQKTETLAKIDEAIARLEKDAYGYCLECGEEIEEKRLRALPFAVRCVDCEEERETAGKQERQEA